MRKHVAGLFVVPVLISMFLIGACSDSTDTSDQVAPDTGDSASINNPAQTGGAPSAPAQTGGAANTPAQTGGAANTPAEPDVGGVGGGLYAPYIISPALDETFYGSTLLPIVHFEWGPVPNAVLYRLRVDYQSDVTGDFFQDIYIETASTTYEFNPVHGYGTYWLTIAVDGPGGDHVNGQQYQAFFVRVRE